MPKQVVNFEEIESFLEGRDPQKYIVSVEANYQDPFVSLVINDPETGKRIEKHKYQPFVWLKEEVFNLIYQGKGSKIREAKNSCEVTIKKLKIDDGDGNIPNRLDSGFKYIAKCKHGYGALLRFFQNGGIGNIYDDEYRSLFVTFTPAEQFLIQSGKRLFKGFDDYDEVHRLQFDLETEGLDASTKEIFQIGIKDNRGFSTILETKGETLQERRDSERLNINRFFEIIDELKPDIITAFNSEDFDWPFFETRCDRLSISMKDMSKTLNPKSKIRRKEATLKLGQESVKYLQTNMWGYNILDVSHSVRRAQAINSDIKSWGLKYITKFSKAEKKNRVYVTGSKINKTWKDDRDHWFNEEDGSWGLLEGSEYVNKLPDHLKIVKGDYIVRRYLEDDLWETEKVDAIYNQASFLLGKILPTTYQRSSTMGTAGQWKLIMAAWSYEKELGIPDYEAKRDFTGGLSRLLEVGYARNVGKLDFAGLYPKSQLTWKIFPDLDISGVMEGLLTYVVDSRDEFKFLMGKHKAKAKEYQQQLDDNIDRLPPERIANGKEMIEAEKKLSSDYDKKQLPLKILANSWFGSYGAPYIFNWGETNSAEETTCRGRQSLRFMVRFFTEKYNFRPLVLDTDGVNFAMPDTINEVKYVAKGSHWKTTDVAGKELSGLDAVLAEFNEKHMEGRMGLDIDDICESTINFKRKNYANKIDGKVKLVGNSIKSKAMPTYIEEFLDKGIELLLDGKGYEFINWYYDYVDKIYNYQIPMVKIASKSKVKMTIKNYKNNYCKQKTKAGKFKSRQAHMELAIQNNLKVNNGDIIYYINTGTAKSHSDIKAVTNKETGKKEITFNCKLIPQSQVEENPDMMCDDYNVAKYLNAFNERLSSLLVCFHPDIRDEILINTVKDRKTKQLILQERKAFTESQCELVAGMPIDPEDQDDYMEDLMRMEDKEIKFWISVDKLPNFMDEEDWDDIKADYKERMRIQREENIQKETERLKELIDRLEVSDFFNINTRGELPKSIQLFAEGDMNRNIISKKYGVVLASFDDVFDVEPIAIERDVYYKSLGYEFSKLDPEDKYQMWLDYVSKQEYAKPLETNPSGLTKMSYGDIIDTEQWDKCSKGECGGCEHCDGMGSEESIKIEEKAYEKHQKENMGDDEWNF